MHSNDARITEQLRGHGLRVTAARHAVLAWLADHPHATAEHVHEGAYARLGAVSKQAVYDVLAACVDAGLVRQIKPSGHPARFERCSDDNHHHLVCRNCGRIQDVACAHGVKPCLTPAHHHGFVIDEAEVMFWGLCEPCGNHAMQPSDNNA